MGHDRQFLRATSPVQPAAATGQDHSAAAMLPNDTTRMQYHDHSRLDSAAPASGLAQPLDSVASSASVLYSFSNQTQQHSGGLSLALPSALPLDPSSHILPNAVQSTQPNGNSALAGDSTRLSADVSTTLHAADSALLPAADSARQKRKRKAAEDNSAAEGLSKPGPSKRTKGTEPSDYSITADAAAVLSTMGAAADEDTEMDSEESCEEDEVAAFLLDMQQEQFSAQPTSRQALKRHKGKAPKKQH